MNFAQLLLSITSGVAVTSLVAFGQFAWARTKVPVSPSRRMNRRSYLRAIHRASTDEKVRQLCALVPNLTPARGRDQLTRIQEAWQEIDKRGSVRILTREDQDCLAAGAELLSRGIEVRVNRTLNTDDLSLHIFSTESSSRVVINHRDGSRDRPGQLIGLSPAQVFRSHFDHVWETAAPLESVLAEEVLATLKPGVGPEAIAAQLTTVRAKYRLSPGAEEAVLRHVAFRHSAQVIFVTGLPGAGKSMVRRQLARKLAELRFQVGELSDYIYAFRDFLHHAIDLGDGRGDGFTAHAGGAFQVRNEHDLEPALQALSKKVWAGRGHTPLSLVEFARSDLVAALQVFDDEVVSTAQIIHVQASAAARDLRLVKRAQPPRIAVNGQEIVIRPSDDHQLPSSAAKSLYASDSFAQLSGLKEFAGRVHQIDNDTDDPDFARLDKKLDTIIADIIRPYRAAGTITHQRA